MDSYARVSVNCGWKDGRTENRMPISHLAKAGATKMEIKHNNVLTNHDTLNIYFVVLCYCFTSMVHSYGLAVTVN